MLSIQKYNNQWSESKFGWVILVVLWAIPVVSSLFYNIWIQKQQVIASTTERGRNLFQIIELTRHWNAKHGGVYVPITQSTQPNLYLNVPNRDVVTTDGTKLTKVNPAFMTRQIAEIAIKQGVVFHITSLNPIRPMNKADEWETKALTSFSQGKQEYTELIRTENTPVFRYMAPLKVKTACLNCHKQQGYKKGDVRGGISVNLDASDTLMRYQQQKNYIQILHIIIFLVVSILIYILYQKNRQNLLDLEILTKVQEKTIEERTHKLSSILNSTAEGIYGINPKGECTFINPSALSILGYTDEKLVIGQDMHELIHHTKPDGTHFFVKDCPIFKAFWSGKGIHIDSELLWRGDGSSFKAEYWSYPIVQNGKVMGAVVSFFDITQRKANESKLQLAAKVFSHAREGIIITDADANIVDANQAFSDISGYQSNEVMGKTPHIFSSGRHDSAFYLHLWKQLNEQGEWSGEIWNRHKDGKVYAALVTISAITDNNKQTEQYIALYTDITQLKEQQKQLEHLAHYDTLTQLPNRTLLADRMMQFIKQEKRRKINLAVLYLDLDGFKEVNDTYGHKVGDKLLQVLSKRMQDCLRKGDTISRIGGDEFVLLLLDLESEADVIILVKRLIELVAQKVPVNGVSLSVSASVGVTFYPQREVLDPEQLLHQADQAMYQAKEAGKNGYQLYQPDMDLKRFKI